MLHKKNNLLTVSMLCEIARVSRSGYYNWVNSENTRIEKENNDRCSYWDWKYYTAKEKRW